MSDLFIPNRPPANPSNGVDIQISNDGPNVVLKFTLTIPLDPHNASGLAGAIGAAADEARKFQLAVLGPFNGKQA